MDKKLSFSFIMPAYKREYMSKAIKSILDQEYNNLELVVINDASPDNLEEIVYSFCDKRINYITNEHNIGGRDLVANWNHCIQFAQNEYIILATDDDIFAPAFLSDAIILINKYPTVDIIRSGVSKIDENDNILDIEFPSKEYMTSREFSLFYAKGHTISCVSNYIYRKDALINNGGFISFSKAHFSDDATALLLAKNGIACVSKNDFLFRVSNINLSNRGDINLVLEQLRATDCYMTWFCEHIKKLDTNHNDFFERACYGGIKAKYLSMTEKLINKIPITRLFLALKSIYSSKHLFKNEKTKLTILYILNKITMK